MNKKIYKSISYIIVIIICVFILCACSKIGVHKRITDFEKDFNIELPDNYKCVFNKSITSIDSNNCYIVIKYDGDFKLNYENQFFSEYANYESFDIFTKMDLAKSYFSNIINEEDEKYFVNKLENYDWYAYEYISVTDGNVKVTRYADLYVLEDLDNSLLYIFYDKHQYPYDNQEYYSTSLQ